MGNKMERYTPVLALPPRVTDEVICVRVSRLWYHRGGTDQGPIKDIHMVIVDIQGDAFHAVVPHGFSSQFIHILHEKNVYEISKFLLVKKQGVIRPLDKPFAIKITHLTVIRRMDNLIGALPEWCYSLTPISCLPAPAADPGCLVDVIGIICGISDIKSFAIPQRHAVLIKRHVYLRDLSGHEIKIVLWGNCALRFNGNVIRSLGQTESAVAIFVGTTVQEYDGERGLAGRAACSWYINEDIIDINIFRGSLEEPFQPIANAPLPHILSLRTQFGVNWPRKDIVQLAAFNLFENKDARFRCTVTLSRVHSRKQWWFVGCQLCHRMARPTISAYGDPLAYTCSSSFCSSTAAYLVYRLLVIASDQTDEAEFILFGSLAEQVIGNSISQVIRGNQPAGAPVANGAVAASRVRFPPPEVSRILGNRYIFVVRVAEGSFSKGQTSFMVETVEASFPRVRRLSSLDTIIPATSWDVGNPTVVPAPSADSYITEPGPSNQRGAARRFARNEDPSAGLSAQVQPGIGNSTMPLMNSTIAAFNRRNRKLVLDSRRGLTN